MKGRAVIFDLLAIVVLIVGGYFIIAGLRAAGREVMVDTSVAVVLPEIKDSCNVRYEAPTKEVVPDKPAIKFTLDGDMGEELEVRSIGCDLPPPPEPVEENSMVCFFPCEPQPEFPGGEESLHKFLTSNVRYPESVSDLCIEGTVFVTFVVNEDGSITDIKTVGRHRGAGLEEEAIRVMRLMPKWKPAKQSGKSVKTQFNLPIRFTIAEE